MPYEIYIQFYSFMRNYRNDLGEIKKSVPPPDMWDYVGDPDCRLFLYSPAFTWVTWDMTPDDLVLTPKTPPLKAQEYLEKKLLLNKGQGSIFGSGNYITPNDRPCHSKYPLMNYRLSRENVF